MHHLIYISSGGEGGWVFKWTILTELHSYSYTIAVNSGRGGEETVHSGAAGLFHYLTEREKVRSPGLTDSAWEPWRNSGASHLKNWKQTVVWALQTLGIKVHPTCRSVLHLTWAHTHRAQYSVNVLWACTVHRKTFHAGKIRLFTRLIYNLALNMHLDLVYHFVRCGCGIPLGWCFMCHRHTLRLRQVSSSITLPYDICVLYWDLKPVPFLIKSRLHLPHYICMLSLHELLRCWE